MTRPSQDRQLFTAQGCGRCHALADAGSSGTTGPNLDAAFKQVGEQIGAEVGDRVPSQETPRLGLGAENFWDDVFHSRLGQAHELRDDNGGVEQSE